MLTTVLAAFAFASAPLAEVPAKRVEALDRGINLSHWWAQAGRYDAEHLDGYMRPEDFDGIAKAGFRHVRLTLEPLALWDGQPEVALRQDKVDSLKRWIRLILGRKLAVIVDAHPGDGLKLPLANDSAARDAFVRFWRLLAAELKGFDPDRLFVELLNEPVIEKEAWLPYQGVLIEAVREVLPQTTLIVSGAKWSGVPDFLEMAPYKDKNLVYNFHCYEPFAFTHQGATWGWDLSKHFKELPFPSSPSALAGVLPKMDLEAARSAAKDYGDQRWNQAKMEELVRACARWGRTHRVPVTCNEFGAYVAAPRESRLRYLETARKAFEANEIGWTMWDYNGGFRAFNGQPGNRSLDTQVAKALGLL